MQEILNSIMHGICKWQDNTLSNVMYNSRLQHVTNIKVRTLTGDRSGHAKGHMLTLLPSHTCTCKKGDHCY